MSALPSSSKQVRLCRVAGNNPTTRFDVERTYPNRETWKEECKKDIDAWSHSDAVDHLNGCDPAKIKLVDTIMTTDTLGAIFVYRCPCKRAEVIVSQLN